MKRVTVLVTILIGGLVFAPAAQAATTCTPSQWPAPPGATSYSVTATDGRGTYVGGASYSDGSSTVIWHANGDIERVDGFNANDMNSSGVMSGTVRDANRVSHAATRTLAGVVTQLTTSESFTRAINAHNDVAGMWLMGPPAAASFAIVWHAGDPARGETLDAWGFSSAYGIDDNRIVAYVYQWRGASTVHIVQLVPGGTKRQLQRYNPVGTYQPIQPVEVDRGLVLATRREQGQEQELILIDAVAGTITPVPGAGGFVTPSDLNNGIVVGAGVTGATMWRHGETIVLPPLAGTTSSAATLVNADGTEVFGTSSTGRAVVWRCSP